jgi:hypothetical protein
MPKTGKEKFEGQLLLGHKGAAVEVPFDPEEKWTVSARVLWPVRRGHTVRAELNRTECPLVAASYGGRESGCLSTKRSKRKLA